MKLSDYLSKGNIIHKEAKLKIDLELDDGESRKKGDVVSVLMKFPNGTYHVEDNEFSCTVYEHEIKFI